MDLKFLLEQTAGVTVVFTLAVVAARTLRRHSAASRHLVWWIGMLVALFLPLVSWWKPAGAPTIILTPAPAEIVVSSMRAPQPPAWTSIEVLTAAWFVGFALLAARLVVGLLRSELRRRGSIPSSIEVERRGTEVRFSNSISVPETFGAWRPVILLPAEAVDWPGERLQVVLTHELLHIQRRDWLTQLTAQITACIYWFHPLAWLALSQMRKEGELACDDGVLRLGYKNSDYAQHLVDVARSVRTIDEALSPSVAMATQSQLEARVRAILNPTMNRGNVTTMMKIAAILSAVLTIVLFSSAGASAAGTAKISGTVSDASNALAPDTMLILAGSQGKTLATTSGASGEWAFGAVEAGDYNLEAKKPGFRAYQRKITVAAGTPISIDIRLHLGTLQENVTVQGETSRPSDRSNAVPQRIRVGGDVQAAKLLQRVLPEYPIHLKQADISGTVVLQAVISREGNILNVQVASPDAHPDLITAATGAVKQWKYAPTLLNGVPVEVVTMINVNFTLLHKG